jgi:drug/metabolite transporter (DMT)-like permease
MTALRFIWILVCVVMISSGQILFKYAAVQSGKSPGFLALAKNPYLISAVVIYGAATLLWVWQLKYVPLNRAYPLFALAFAIVPLLSWGLFGERIRLVYVLGVILIVSGIVLCVRNY